MMFKILKTVSAEQPFNCFPGAFQRFPESVEEEAAVTEQVQERIPKVEVRTLQFSCRTHLRILQGCLC